MSIKSPGTKITHVKIHHSKTTHNNFKSKASTRHKTNNTNCIAKSKTHSNRVNKPIKTMNSNNNNNNNKPTTTTTTTTTTKQTHKQTNRQNDNDT
jgi:hypothetical protein